MATKFTQAEVITQVSERLFERYPETSRDTITSLATEELGKISDSKVTDYFTVLTERAVRQRLRA